MRKKLTQKTVDAAKPHARPYSIHDTELRGFLLRVQPTGLKTYYAKYRVQGKQSQIRIADAAVLTAKDARDAARQTLAGVAKGIDPMLERRRGRARTLADFLDEFYAPWATANKRSGEATVKRLKAAFASLLARPLGQLTPAELDKWCTRRADHGKAKPATIQRDVAALRAALARAVAWELLSRNPLESYQAGSAPEARVRFLSAAEEGRLVTALEHREEEMRQERDSANQWRADRGYDLLPDLRAVTFADHLRPMVLISLNTGLRRGELFALRWADVDLDTGILTVRGATSKGGKARWIPLSAQALDTFRAWRAQTDSAGLVFASDNGKAYDNVNSSWRAVLIAAEITGFTWHDMRHTFASKLVSAGVSLFQVQSLLGHSSPQMSTRYAHLAEDSKAQAVKGLEFGGNVLPFAPVAKTDAG